ncbi:MAG TPA: hypothetical protein VIR58_05405 [Acidimicrobiales bacterium]
MDQDRPVDCRSMIGLRCTAAMVTTLPSVRARVRDEGRVVLEVSSSPHPAEHRVVCPCGFRRSIADAHQRRLDGEQMALRGAPSGAPSIEWGVAPGDLSLPGSMVRVAEGEDWLHVAAVAAPIELCNAALGGDDLLREVGLLSAPDLDVTLLHATTPAGEDAVSDEAIDVVQAALARVAVHVMLEGLGHNPARHR